MIDVTTDDCGVWVSAYEVRNPNEFMIRVVDLAIDYGLEVSDEWGAIRAIASDNAADNDTIEIGRASCRERV